MISTSILYCNKLDALPLTSDLQTSDSTSSNSLLNSIDKSGGRFRVRYLGSNSCNIKIRKLNDGISSFQKSLLELYTNTRRRSFALRSFYSFALNQVIDVCSYGVVVAERDPTIIRLNCSEGETVVTKVITPLSNILLWAAVRFNYRVSGRRREFGAAFVPLSCSDAVLNQNSFIPLSSKQRFLVGLPHPPLFACILQKVSNPQELECHLFVCASSEDAISLCALLSDTQKHCSKIGALELPLPGQMGNYSYKSPSRLSRSTNNGHIRHFMNDTQSDSSRVGGKSTSISSYKSRFTPTTQLKSKYKFRPLHQQQEQNSHQSNRKHPFEKRTQIEDIHTKNLPQIPVENNSRAALQLRDYRSRSYRFSDNTRTPTTTPTTSSSPEIHHCHYCNYQRYQSRNNSRNGLMRKRDMRKVYCNCNNGNNIAINSNNKGIKYMQKNAKRFTINSNAIERNIKNGREVTSVHYKCSTSSDSGEPKLGTKANFISGNKMCHKGSNKSSNNYKFNNDHNLIREEIMNTRVIPEMSDIRNYVMSNERNNYVKKDQKTRDCKRNALQRKHRKQDIIEDSSFESSNNSEIIVKDNVMRLFDNKQQYLLRNNKGNAVPKVVKSTQSPQRRYFGDTLRGAKSFEDLNNSSNSSTTSDDKVLQQKHLVRVRNATTSCRDAPWIMNKNNQSMTVSKTIFLGSESDSKKSSSLSHISSDSITKRDRTKSSPDLICSKDVLDCVNASDSVELTREAQIHSNYKLIDMNTRSQSSRSGSPFARNNRFAVYLPHMKCVKSFNSRTDVKQWSTLSLSSNVEANISADKSAPNSRPDLSYKTTKPIVEHETLSVNVPRIIRLNSPEYKTRNRSSLLTRLRRMSLRSWVSARKGTTRFLSKFKSKRRRRKRFSNPSTDSAIDVDTNDFRSEVKTYSVNEQNINNLRRKHSWSFHDFTASYPKPIREDKNKHLMQCSSSGTPSPSFELQKSALSNIEILDNKSYLKNFSLSSKKLEITGLEGSKTSPVNQSNNLNGVKRLENSMSSDSGMEEIDCLSSTDVTNSLNSRRKPLLACNKEMIGNDFQNDWKNLQFKASKQQVNHIVNKRKPFRHWSQTDLQQELGYMP